MNMKCRRTYVVLATALLLNSNLFVHSGWSAKTDVISFLSQKGEDIHLMLINTRGEIHQSILTDLERSSLLHLVARWKFDCLFHVSKQKF